MRIKRYYLPAYVGYFVVLYHGFNLLHYCCVTVTIAINDVNEAPLITNLPRTVTVTENVAGGASLHLVLATDSENDPLFYYIQVGPADQDSFTVNNLSTTWFGLII